MCQVAGLDEFRLFLDPYIEQTIQGNIRFSSHAPLVKAQNGVKIAAVELSHCFENFTSEIHNLIEQEGEEASYVFDCL